MSEDRVARQLIVGQYYWEMGEGEHRSGNIVKILRLYERPADKRIMAEVDILNKHKCKVDNNHHIPACNIDLTRRVDELTVNKLRVPILDAIKRYFDRTTTKVNAF